MGNGDGTMDGMRTVGNPHGYEDRRDADTLSGDQTLAGDGHVVLAGRYEVVKRLGEGGMGSVWLAEDRKLDGRKVALKMLPAVLSGKKAAYRQVKTEALMAMRLAHPNIATVRSFEEDEGNPFLVMDFIEGEGLDDILAEKGTLSEEETRKLLGFVAAALDYAHAQGVVHRDVKPGNVMVRKDGTPFVLDFGIAREIQETMTRVTGKLSSGTLLYMSPEQLRGRAPKPSQDVYSFAAMAYECLTGNPPFSRGQIEWQIVNENPEDLPESVPEALRRSVMAGLAKDPKDRPDTCVGVLGETGLPSMPQTVGVAVPGEPKRQDSGLPHHAEWRDSDSAETPRPTTEAASARRAGDVKTITLPGGATMEMVWCPPGEFDMGSNNGDNDENPVHRVTLSRGFWMAKTEVTQKQWQSVMGNNPSDHKGDNLPVENVSWNDAQEFCRKAGHGLRLPTEAQWEYACRAGSTGACAGTGKLDEMGWSRENSGDKTHPVGEKVPNAWGLHDMHGNVWEWCEDWYGDYPTGTATDPAGPSSGLNRVYRGGSWYNNARSCRSAYRGYGVPGGRNNFLGLRVALRTVQ